MLPKFIHTEITELKFNIEITNLNTAIPYGPLEATFLNNTAFGNINVLWEDVCYRNCSNYQHLSNPKLSVTSVKTEKDCGTAKVVSC
jgi:hypothetical protein